LGDRKGIWLIKTCSFLKQVEEEENRGEMDNMGYSGKQLLKWVWIELMSCCSYASELSVE